jgi:hypothetical protein
MADNSSMTHRLVSAPRKCAPLPGLAGIDVAAVTTTAVPSGSVAGDDAAVVRLHNTLFAPI